MPSKGSRDYKYIADPKTGESRPESNVIAEKRLGRPLRADEQVDHRDGNTKNNAPSNLRVVSKESNEKRGGAKGGKR